MVTFHIEYVILNLDLRTLVKKKASLLVAMISLIGLLGPFGCSGLSEELFAGTIDTDTLVERLSSLNQYLADYVGAAQSDLNNISRYKSSLCILKWIIM